MPKPEKDITVEDAQMLAREMGQILRSMGAHEPDWRPLEKAMPIQDWCSGFMFMGYDGKIRVYKHGFTRLYLHLDEKGNAYRYVGEPGRYERIPRREAIESAFDGLKEMGVSRSRPFDDKARAERHKAMADAGWTVVGVDVSEGDDPYVVLPTEK
jgi:hypothetical protein